MRLTRSGTFAAAVLWGASAALSAPLLFQSPAAPNLLAYYPLDETTVGAADDAVGANDGTHVDNPTPNTDVAPLSFNTAASRSLGFTDAGTTASTGDRVTLPNGVVNGRTTLTATWWMKTSKTGEQAIVSGANSTQNNEYLLFFSSNLNFRHHDKGTSFNYAIPSISDNAWHHVAVVRDAGTNMVTVYTDGASRGSQSVTASALNVAAGGLVVGEEQDAVGGSFSAAQSFVGLLDDLRFYDRALNANEVAYLAAGNGPPPAPTLTSATGYTDPATLQARVDLAWTAVTTTPATPVTYTLLRGTTMGGPYPITVTSGATGTTFTDTGVVTGTTYYYVVRATNVGGTSGDSNELSATPQPIPPRTNDHEEGIFGTDCGCGAARPGALWALALGGLVFLLAGSAPRASGRPGSNCPR
jgi:hypothetical protein